MQVMKKFIPRPEQAGHCRGCDHMMAPKVLSEFLPGPPKSMEARGQAHLFGAYE